MYSWVFLLLAVYCIYKAYLHFQEEEPLEEVQAIEIQDFTPASLQKYNGRDDPHILMAIKGKVYDVTAGGNHYGPGGPYATFAGRDASRGLAKHSFDEDMLTPIDQPNDTLSDLTTEEMSALDQWAEFFASKYPYCGNFVDTKKFT